MAQQHNDGLAQTITHAYVGTTGTGKTTKCLEHAKRLGGRILVVVDNATVQGWDDIKVMDPTQPGAFNFKGIRKILFDDWGPDIVWGNIHKFFRNGCLIADDCAMFIEANWNHNKALKKVVIQHRHNSIDIFFVVHQFNDLPPKLWGYLKFLYIGKLMSIPQKTDIKIADPGRLINIATQINKEVSEIESKGGSAWGQFYCYKNF